MRRLFILVLLHITCYAMEDPFHNYTLEEQSKKELIITMEMYANNLKHYISLYYDNQLSCTQLEDYYKSLHEWLYKQGELCRGTQIAPICAEEIIKNGFSIIKLFASHKEAEMLEKAVYYIDSLVKYIRQGDLRLHELDQLKNKLSQKLKASVQKGLLKRKATQSPCLSVKKNKVDDVNFLKEKNAALKNYLKRTSYNLNEFCSTVTISLDTIIDLFDDLPEQKEKEEKGLRAQILASICRAISLFEYQLEKFTHYNSKTAFQCIIYICQRGLPFNSIWTQLQETQEIYKYKLQCIEIKEQQRKKVEDLIDAMGQQFPISKTSPDLKNIADVLMAECGNNDDLSLDYQQKALKHFYKVTKKLFQQNDIERFTTLINCVLSQAWMEDLHIIDRFTKICDLKNKNDEAYQWVLKFNAIIKEHFKNAQDIESLKNALNTLLNYQSDAFQVISRISTMIIVPEVLNGSVTIGIKEDDQQKNDAKSMILNLYYDGVQKLMEAGLFEEAGILINSIAAQGDELKINELRNQLGDCIMASYEATLYLNLPDDDADTIIL